MVRESDGNLEHLELIFRDEWKFGNYPLLTQPPAFARRPVIGAVDVLLRFAGRSYGMTLAMEMVRHDFNLAISEVADFIVRCSDDIRRRETIGALPGSYDLDQYRPPAAGKAPHKPDRPEGWGSW